MADAVVAVHVLRNGKIIRLTAEECGFSYRHSSVVGTVIRAELKADRVGDVGKLRTACEDNLRLRRLKQPLGASAGCVFKASDGIPAAKLIEDAGLKGFTAGGAEISQKHANFIVNRGGAASADILYIINTVQAVVYDKFGVKLEREIKYYGDFY